MIVSKLSQSCFEAVPKLSQSCLKVVPKLYQSCIKVVSKLYQSCLKVVPKLYQSCIKVVSKLSQSCIKVFPKNPSCAWTQCYDWGPVWSEEQVLLDKVSIAITSHGGGNKFWISNWELYGTWFDEGICLLRLILFAGFTTSTNTDWCYRPANLWYSANRTLLDSRVWWIGLEKTNIKTTKIEHSEWIGFLYMNLYIC